MRVAIISVTAVIGVALSVSARADGPFGFFPAAARATSFQVGKLSVTALEDGRNVVANNGKVFGVGTDPAQLGNVLRAAGASTDRITLNTGGLLVRSGKRLLLLDTGMGPKMHANIMASLKLAGIAPRSITDVLITHSHGDHVGGLLDEQGKPAFPNATIRMTSAEWSWMQQQGSAEVVAAIRPHLRTFEPGAQIAPGVKAIVLTGHTPGHSGYEISSGSSRLLDLGDMVHSSIVSLARPDWKLAFDSDSATATATRQSMLAKLAADQTWVFAPHFPFPGVGHIVAAGQGFAFSPGLPE
jgi:glyoxylase-like metal-dependent hydrolase (beta-lactamase superfamily II)